MTIDLIVRLAMTWACLCGVGAVLYVGRTMSRWFLFLLPPMLGVTAMWGSTLLSN